MNRVDRTLGREVFLGPLYNSIGTGEVDEIGVEFVGPDVVKLCGGAVVEPAGVVLPDGPHIPRHLAVSLADLEFGGQGDLSHQGVNILARVHAFHGSVVEIGDRVAQTGQFGVDALGTSN